MTSSNALKLTVIATALLMVGGCASKSPAYYAETRAAALAKFATQKPKEKWSDALIIAEEGMGLYGIKDLTQEQLSTAQMGQQPNASGASGSSADLALGMGGVLSGNPGAGAMSIGLALIPTSQAPGTAQLDQVVAWVAADRASSMDEAGRLAVDEWNKARAKV